MAKLPIKPGFAPTVDPASNKNESYPGGIPGMSTDGSNRIAIWMRGDGDPVVDDTGTNSEYNSDPFLDQLLQLIFENADASKGGIAFKDAWSIYSALIQDYYRRQDREYSVQDSNTQFNREKYFNDLNYERTKFNTIYNQLLASGMSPAAAMQAASGLAPSVTGTGAAAVGRPLSGLSPIQAGSADTLFNGIGQVAGAISGLGSLGVAISQVALNRQQYETASWYQNGVRDSFNSDNFQSMVKHALKGGANYSDGEWFDFDKVKKHWYSPSANEDEKLARKFYEDGISSDGYFNGAIDHFFSSLVNGRGGSYADSFLAGQKMREFGIMDRQMSILDQEQASNMFDLSSQRSILYAKLRAVAQSESGSAEFAKYGITFDGSSLLFTDPDGNSVNLFDGKHDDQLFALSPGLTSSYDSLQFQKDWLELSMFTEHPEIYDKMASSMMNKAEYEEIYYQNLAVLEDTSSRIYSSPQYKAAQKFCAIYEKYNQSIQNEISKRNAESNALNAESNVLNAITNSRNADINQQNANTNEYNAETQRLNLSETERHNKYQEYISKATLIQDWEKEITFREYSFGPFKGTIGVFRDDSYRDDILNDDPSITDSSNDSVFPTYSR